MKKFRWCVPLAFTRTLLIVLIGLISASRTWANWCTVTYLKFNEEVTKMAVEGDPFKIETLDPTGHTMALVTGSERHRYKYLRNVSANGLEFREFRSDSMIFQLSMPRSDGTMVYQRFYKDQNGIERGFVGLCSGA